MRDRQRAAEALVRLHISYIIPNMAHGKTCLIPQLHTPKDFRKSFDDLLPSRDENQTLIFQLHEIERIESEGHIEIELESYNAR